MSYDHPHYLHCALCLNRSYNQTQSQGCVKGVIIATLINPSIRRITLSLRRPVSLSWNVVGAPGHHIMAT